MTLEDRAGIRVRLDGFPDIAVGGDFPPGSEQTTNFPEKILGCHHRGPFHATVNVGRLSASRVGLSAREVGCLGE